MSKKSDAKNHTTKQDDIIDVEPTSSSSKHYQGCHNKKSWNVGKLFWGLLLIVIGGLMLANNFGIVDVNWGNLWRLWPLIIISIGLSVLSFHSLIWKILVVILTISTVGFIGWVAIGGPLETPVIHTQEKTINMISNGIKKANINVKAGASELHINSANQADVANAKLESNFTTLSSSSTQSGDIQRVNFSMDSTNNWWAGDARNIMDINISRSLPIELNVEAGASNTQIDMSRAKLTSLNVKSGASNLDVKFGSMQDSVLVNIDSGASSIKLRIPNEVGAQLKIDGGLNTKDLDGLGEVSKDIYESSNYIDSKKRINIIAKTGVSKIIVERY